MKFFNSLNIIIRDIASYLIFDASKNVFSEARLHSSTY